jgi:hypothetical protein
MLKILEDIAYHPEKRAAFEQDPEAFVEQYDGLTDYEKYLLVEQDAAAIEGYLRNGPVPTGDNAIYAAPTIVTVQAVIIIIRKPHEEPALAAAKRFDAYWNRITDHAQVLAN